MLPIQRYKKEVVPVKKTLNRTSKKQTIFTTLYAKLSSLPKLKTNLLIADPNKADWDVISETLTGEGSSVYFAGSAGETEKLLTEKAFFLGLLELELPGGGGVPLVRKIKRLYPDMAVALVSSQKSFEVAVEAVGAGAVDYLFKPVCQDDLLNLVERSYNQHCHQEHIKQIIAKMESDLDALRDFYGFEQAAVFQRRELSLDQGVQVDLDRSEFVVGENRIQLSPGELALITVFLEHQGEILSPEEIFRQVYGREPAEEDPSENARTMVFRLRKKLSMALPNHSWIQNIRGEGYSFNTFPAEIDSLQGDER